MPDDLYASLSDDDLAIAMDDRVHFWQASQVSARLGELQGYPRPSRTQRAELAALETRHAGIMRAEADSRRASELGAVYAAKLAANPGMGEGPGIAPSDSPRATDPARRVLEARHRDGRLPDYAAERCERLLGAGYQDRTLAAAYIEAAGTAAYERAFMSLVADPQRGHMLWDREEQDAYKAVQRIRAAMTISTGSGGDMIPLTLDPALMLTNAGSNNVLRQIARVVQTVSNTWQGVASAGATAEWKTEGAQAADGSPATTPKPIPVYMADVDVPYSYEVGMDAVGFQDQLQKVMTDAITQLTNTAYTTGGGSTLPKGFVPNATAPARTAGAFTVADVYLLQNSLPPRFSGNAEWCANIAVLNTIAQFQIGTTQYAFPEIRNSPPRLLQKAVHEISNMSADMTTAASRFLAYGDFQQYVIADRLGSTLEILPGYGANQRPSGQRHAFMTFRSGGDLVIPTAIQVIAKS